MNMSNKIKVKIRSLVVEIVDKIAGLLVLVKSVIHVKS